jgi:RES domain-containing protein
MIAYRLCKSKYARDLTGKGPEKSGGRWNSKGTAIIYASESRALCTAEIAVHTPIGNLPDDYVILTIQIPDSLKVAELKSSTLPADWRSFPHPDSTQKLGDRFIREQKTAILKVPSAVVQGEYNYLLNPAHKDFKKIRIRSVEPFHFDERLFRKKEIASATGSQARK